MTTCLDPTTTEWPRSQADWLTGDVTVNLTINAQPVTVSIDGGTTFLTAEWTGDPGTTRSWQVYITPDDLPEGLTYEVLVKVHDTSGPQPVDVVLPAGTITIT